MAERQIASHMHFLYEGLLDLSRVRWTRYKEEAVFRLDDSMLSGTIELFLH